MNDGEMDGATSAVWFSGRVGLAVEMSHLFGNPVLRWLGTANTVEERRSVTVVNVKPSIMYVSEEKSLTRGTVYNGLLYAFP
jgi:hypothetical protein